MLAIITVISLIVINQLITQYSLHSLEQKGEVMDLTEHQEFLSQEIAKLAFRMKQKRRQKAKIEVMDAKRDWIVNFQLLELAAQKSALTDKQRRNIEVIMKNIQPIQDSIVAAIPELVNPSSQVDRSQAIAVIQRQEDNFLPLIKELREEWRIITKESMRQMRLIQLLLALVSLLILGFETFFVFLPVFRQVQEKNKALQKAHDEEKTLNEELIAIQEELQQSLDYQTNISKKLEEAKQRAEDASRAKEQFLTTMSHEIRTPMNAVIGLVSLLLEDNPKPTQLENLQALKFSGDTLLALINDILDYSKIEAGKIELEEIKLNLKNLFYGIKQSLGVNAVEKEIALNCHLSNDIPEILLGDPTRLSQILNNLVSNAIKFTLQGEVNLKAELIQICEEVVSITFTVQDTGIGITEDKIAAIFEPFTQASKDITRKFGGTGLGLSISKKLLEIQQSQLKVESKANQGTTFSFTLDFKYIREGIEEKMSLTQGQQSLGLKGIRVLVAEDNHMNVIVIRQFLKKWGVDFQIVENGELAVEVVKREQFDVVLMDLHMPVMDGFTASMEIRKFNQKIPIIALTASATSDAKLDVYTAGMNDFAAKPFIPDELYNKIERNLGVSRGLGMKIRT